MEIQLRDYRIRQGQMDSWIAGWKSAIVPLREEEGFEAANDRYYASPRRKALHPEPSELIAEARRTMVEAVL